MNRPEAHKLFSELLSARDRDQHLEFFQEHIEDLCDAAILAVADIDPDETDWFGKVRWCNDDIVDALQYKLINPTDENVARVRDQLEHHGFRDMQVEAGWDYIYSTIDNLELDDDDEEEEVALPEAADLPDVFDFYSHDNSITRGKKYHATRKPEQGYFFVALEDSDCTWDIHVSEFTENFANHNWEMIN